MDASGTRWGEARWDTGKVARWSVLHLGAAAGGVLCFSWSAVAVFAGLLVVTLGLGVSVGIHRGVIHRAFRASRGVERVLGFIGTLAGLGGVLGMSRMHQLRDFHQNQPESECPEYFGYREGFTSAMTHALFRTWHVRDENLYPPVARDVVEDSFFRALERAGLWLQVPLALVLYAVGGPSWVAWGIFVRLALTQDGFWFVHYVSHVEGEQPYELPGCAEQGRNAGWLAVVSMGESWHNNHHAYPGSARMGFGWKQPDPGWWMVRGLAALGLVTEVKTPRNLEPRAGTREQESPTRNDSQPKTLRKKGTPGVPPATASRKPVCQSRTALARGWRHSPCVVRVYFWPSLSCRWARVVKTLERARKSPWTTEATSRAATSPRGRCAPPSTGSPRPLPSPRRSFESPRPPAASRP
ncbi:acyl-CoA desaturase [Myxococcus landrumensis]|nr:acyl-CoA desaturase [Myxococcus landrumus]